MGEELVDPGHSLVLTERRAGLGRAMLDSDVGVDARLLATTKKVLLALRVVGGVVEWPGGTDSSDATSRLELDIMLIIGVPKIR